MGPRGLLRMLAWGMAGLCVGCGASSSQWPTGDRLVPQPRHGNYWALPHGGVVTDGMEVLQVRHGQLPVTITGVSLVGARDVRLVGARVSGPKRSTYQFSGETGYPSKEGRHSVPAVGASITDAKRGWGLLVGLDVGGSGYPLIEGIEVRYRVGRTEYRQEFRGSVIFCADARPRSLHCQPPKALQRLVGAE